MTPTGCAVMLAVLAAGLAVHSSPVPSALHPPSSHMTLAELAEAQNLTLPARRFSTKAKTPRKAVGQAVRGAQDFPFGVANPLPPPRSRGRTAAATTNKFGAGSDVIDLVRLPTNVVPTRYTVTMAPNIARGIFHGSTDIYLNVLENTKRITLHASADLTMRDVQIFRYDRETDKYFGFGEAKLLPLNQATDMERLAIVLARELVAGEHYLLRFPLFVAELRDDLQGFYLSSYADEYGQTRWLATTQFESISARTAFPCFDEPALKARFKIIVEHDRDLHANSNMPIVRKSQPTLNVVRTEFDETLPISTYLLAWVVSDFVSVTESQNADLPFATWGRANIISPTSTWLSQMVGPRALQGLADFTGIAYSLPKVDQYAIPDFAAGAMENWGLVTYREEYLLETSETNIRIREFIGTTVCHELGHQWTGNLVTLDWWSNTWLNEGFATYFESVICDQIIPQWKLMDKYVVDNVHRAIASDVLPGQHALSSPVIGLESIEDKFDAISYQKGGAVLRMFENILGTETFKKAMKRYLSSNAFKVGSPDRLFRAMHAEMLLLDPAEMPLPENVTFAQMARTWTEQAGVPVVTVTRNYTTSQVNISQEQFLYAKPADEGAAQQVKWFIPVPAEVYSSSADWNWNLTNAPANKRWLTPDQPSLSRDLNAAASQWVVFNPRQIGYYLVNYDETNWKLLSAELAAKPPVLHAATRAQLIHDALALARAGRLRYDVALPFLEALKHEREAAPWRAGVSAIAFLRDRLTTTPAGYALKAFVKNITSEAYRAVDFAVDREQDVQNFTKDEERYLRFYIVSHACYAGNVQCTAAAIKEVNRFLTETWTYSPHADVKESAFCYGVQSSADIFGQFLELWDTAESARERETYGAALACTLEHGLLANILDDILSERLDKSPAEFKELLSAISGRWENHKFVVEYYTKNLKAIRKFTLSGDAYYFYLLAALIKDIRTPEEYDEMSSFVASTFPDETSDVRRQLQLRLEAVNKDLDWYRSHYDAVSSWLFAATGTGPTDPTEPPNPAAPTTPIGPTTPRPNPAGSTPAPPSTTPSGAAATLASTVILALATLAPVLAALLL